MIYFILSDEVVKIGHSADPAKRHASIAIGCPRPCHLIGVTDGGAVEEKQIHSKFAHLRERGEWFRFTEEINRYLSANAVPMDKPVKKFKLDHPLTRFLGNTRESLTAFATRLNMSRMQLYRIMDGENTTMETIEKISAATDGAVSVASFFAAREAAE